MGEISRHVRSGRWREAWERFLTVFGSGDMGGDLRVFGSVFGGELEQQLRPAA